MAGGDVGKWPTDPGRARSSASGKARCSSAKASTGLTRLPALRPADVVAALKRAGFVEKRQKGSHVILWHARQRRTTIVALHGRDMPGPTLRQILRQAGLSEDEFRAFL